jgi:hypothetical protein
LRRPSTALPCIAKLGSSGNVVWKGRFLCKPIQEA